MSKKNCWEFKNCGREANGSKIDELGVCPSSTETRLDMVNGGINAGRSCWVVGCSLCDGKKQGTFAQKYKNCQQCDFYKTVYKEEGIYSEMLMVMLQKLS